MYNTILSTLFNKISEISGINVMRKKNKRMISFKVDLLHWLFQSELNSQLFENEIIH
jgi:hypothetical protein